MLHPPKHKTPKAPLVFTTTYNPFMGKGHFKNILLRHRPIIQSNPTLAKIFPKPPLVAFKKAQNIREKLIRAKLTLPESNDSGFSEELDNTLNILVSLLHEQNMPSPTL